MIVVCQVVGSGSPATSIEVQLSVSVTAYMVGVDVGSSEAMSEVLKQSHLRAEPSQLVVGSLEVVRYDIYFRQVRPFVYDTQTNRGEIIKRFKYFDSRIIMNA